MEPQVTRERIEKFLNRQLKNHTFISERIRLQNEEGFTPNKIILDGTIIISIQERCYNMIELDIIDEWIFKAKKYLENN
jgi:hypothetical protein